MTHAGRSDGLVELVSRQLVVVVVVGLVAGYVLGEVEQSSIRAVGSVGQVVLEIREARRIATTVLDRGVVMVVIAIAARPGLRRTAVAAGLALVAVSVHARHVVACGSPTFLAQMRR